MLFHLCLFSSCLAETFPARASDYTRGFQHALYKCTSNPVYKYRDCTLPINHWIPGACPVQCIRDVQAPGCSRVKSCVVAGFFVGVGKDVKNLPTVSDQLRGLGTGHIIYRIKTKGLLSWNTYFTLSLYRQ